MFKKISSNRLLFQIRSNTQIKGLKAAKKKQTTNAILYAVSSKLQSFTKKIQKENLRQPAHSHARRFKIFDRAVSTKNDLEKVTKERRFIRSQPEKYDYKVP